MHTLKIKRTDFQVRVSSGARSDSLDSARGRPRGSRGPRLAPEVEVWPARCSELGEEVQQSEGSGTGGGISLSCVLSRQEPLQEPAPKTPEDMKLITQVRDSA